MRLSLLVLLLLLIPASSAVAAESSPPPSSDSVTLGVGARVGGYGFREIDGGVLSWNDCRMNGTGLFGTVDLTRHFFGELSFDYYHATAGQAAHAMDRVSLQPMLAVGARFAPGRLITPFVQAGGGPEFTRIDLDGASARKVLPTAFMGIGGEVNVGDFHFGTNVRALSMGLPSHLHGNTATRALEPEHGSPHVGGTGAEIETRQEVAGQMQFTLRYTF